MPEPTKLRQLNRKYWIDTDGEIHTPSGNLIPRDEPLFILRARDIIGRYLLAIYHSRCSRAGQFSLFAATNPDRMRLPGLRSDSVAVVREQGE